MPAIERTFSDTPPEHLYLDTNFVLDYLIPTRPRHQLVVPFLQRVQAMELTTLYSSSLLWMEFAHCIFRQDFRRNLPSDIQERYHVVEQWEEALVRQTYLTSMVSELDEFFAHFNHVEVPLDAEARRLALHYAGQYGLKSQDAIHLASASVAEVFDFGSFDRHFRRVDGLHLWNDRIYGPSVPATTPVSR